MKYIEPIRAGSVYSKGRMDERQIIGFEPAGVADLFKKVDELVKLANEQQREIERLKQLNESNKATYVQTVNNCGLQNETGRLAHYLYSNLLKQEGNLNDI